jgi:hypothetical protein
MSAIRPSIASPLYWPAGVRFTPQWHRERNSAEATDQSATGVQPVTTQGFDLSGIDFWFAGLLAKNISFVVLPSSDEYGNFHFESGWVRFDNLLKTPWLNLKAGKYELDTVVSEKRMLTLSQVGGIYQMYHYLPLDRCQSIRRNARGGRRNRASAPRLRIGRQPTGHRTRGPLAQRLHALYGISCSPAAMAP